MRIAVAVVVWALCPVLGSAEVADSSASGFTSKTTMLLASTPDEVYRKLVRNVGDWWDPEHTYSGDSHNLNIDDKPMGCFCEIFQGKGGVRHMEVLFAAPGKLLVMSGALGPLQSLATAGSMTISLAKTAEGTKLDLTYAVAGYVAKGMNTWAGPVDSVLMRQFARFKSYVEGGRDALKPAAKP
jgi:hypothetical protein